MFLSVEKGKRGFETLTKTLEAVVDEDSWDQFEGCTSQRFDPGSFKTVTEKGIDVYGREVVGVRKVR